ncbi:MAG: transposase [Fusobacteriaceae bacterium]|jgi:hypothetical protein|nr:transposase-like protein [Fusobacteriales bacterium]MDN5303809.1 transposase [Fusobacteriaceae bacterium]
MAKNYFNDQQVNILSKNKYVLKVSNSSITYSEEFKRLFIQEYFAGALPRFIFEKYGFDSEIIGKRRIESSAYRWKNKYLKEGVLGLKDTRKTNSGRTLKRELTDEHKIKKMEAKIRLLEAENELLKKIKQLERGGF